MTASDASRVPWTPSAMPSQSNETNLSRVASMQNQKNVTTRYTYDAGGHLTQTIYPDSSTINHVRDGYGT